MSNINLGSIGINGFQILGASNFDFSGGSVSYAGDVNGDGFADLIIGADGAGGYFTGASYVVFGKANFNSVLLSDVAAGTGGFIISGLGANSGTGLSVSAAGDVNGDGLADLIVGAPGINGDFSHTYVVYGKTDGNAVDLTTVSNGSSGFVISGGSGRLGQSVSDAGDVNGDGLADLIVSAPYASGSPSYVIFGSSSASDVDVSSIASGTGGFAINWGGGRNTGVSSAGDVNGDGLADLIVSAVDANDNAGRNYVVFGKTDGTAIYLPDVANGTGGFAINGEISMQWSGRSVSSAGDVNGDGLSDFIIGADGFTNSMTGHAYVVFGKADGSAINLSDVSSGTGGFVINGEAVGDHLGYSVSDAGDVNGDGLTDLIVGAKNSTINGNGTGRSYVVFGKADGTAINLSDVAAGTGGFAIDGPTSAGYAQSGHSVSAAGDVNGDGLADLIVGAPQFDSVKGRSYVIFGNTDGAFASTTVDYMGITGDDHLSGDASSQTYVTGLGNDDVWGKGGADVVYLGAGNDRVLLNADNIDKLTAGITDGNYARVDGGSGIDTLAIEGSNVTLNLTAIANQGGGMPSSTSRIESIEKIDLNANKVVLNASDVVDMAGMNSFNSGNGWTGLDATVAKHQVVIYSSSLLGPQGNSNGGTVMLNELANWSLASGTATDGSNDAYGDPRTFKIYNNTVTAAQVLVESNITVVGNTAPTGDVTITNTTDAGRGTTSPQKDDVLTAGNTLADAEGIPGTIHYQWQANGSDISGATGDTFTLTAGQIGAQITVVASYIDGYGKVESVNSSATAEVQSSVFEIANIVAGHGGFIINGEGVRDYSGISVSSAGDVNGDGLDDLIIGARGNNTNGTDTGRSYVVFGKADGTAIDLSDIAAGTGGFVINGTEANTWNGYSVSSAGDLNGDGLSDLIIGAPGPDSYHANHSYVVFGKSDGTAINLSDIEAGTGGFVINGENGSRAGNSVAAAGDVNGDGIEDLIVGAKDSGGNWVGRSYVVFGKSDTTAVNLSDIDNGTGGFAVLSEGGDNRSGNSVAAAGDVNGDGYADLIVGAERNSNGSWHGGSSYVVFGKADTGAVSLQNVGNGYGGGFAIRGEASGNYSGWSVASAGDVNGDGLADLIIGAPHAERAYVVFGKADDTNVQLSAVVAGSGGFAISRGGYNGYGTGVSVSSAGDINGDGLTDLLVGAPNYYQDTGRSFVVFGKSDTTGVDLADVAAGTGGFVIEGEEQRNFLGNSVSAAGDLNGDGFADLIVGAPFNDVPHPGMYGYGIQQTQYAGRSYVIFGGRSGFTDSVVDKVGTSGADTIGDDATSSHSLVAGAGNDTISGYGGSDVIYAGAGDDTIILDASNIAALSAGITDGNYARVDGGSGIDTLVVDAGGITMNLYSIANQGGASPSSSSRIESVENIDITGSGNNKLVVNASDVVDMAGMNQFNSGNGWTGLDATVARHQLVIDGDSGDSVVIDQLAHWSSAGTATHGAHTYDVYNNTTSAAQILVDQSVTILENTPYTGGLTLTNDTDSGRGTTTLQQGDVLSVSNDLADADGLGTVHYQWQIDGTNVDGATGLTYTLTEYEVGKVITVNASFIDGYGAKASIAQSTSPVINVNDLGDVSVSGGHTENHWLYAYVSDPDGMNLTNNLQYQWQADGVDISGATGDSYQMAQADIGKAVTVHITYTDDHGTAEDLTSNPTAAVTPELGVNLGAIAQGDGGFVINGEYSWDYSGWSVSAAGDVNGDGLNDLIVGAPYNGYNGSDSGRSYVVFGKTDGTAINLSDIAGGSGGFAINGEAGGDHSGWSVSSAGDINGDGFADLIVGAYYADGNTYASGRSYVVFGKNDGSAVDLSAIASGNGGFVINGTWDYDYSGWSISSAGDVNGDGLADLIVGAPYSDAHNDNNSGRSYVVFGKSGSTAIDLSAVAQGQGGFVIRGQSSGDNSGNSVSAAGDVNGDGFADLIVGAPYRDGSHTETYGSYSYPVIDRNAGASYVVFGKSGGGAVELSAVAAGRGGFVINGEYQYDNSGRSVSAAGDVNGDGLADLIVGAPYDGVYNAGRSFVVFGKAGGTAIDLTTVANGVGGFVINGEYQNDNSGWSVSSAGDINGDGLADLIVGAPYNDPYSYYSAGRSYVVFGKTDGTAINLSDVAAGNGGFAINGENNYDSSGRSVSAAGDINGDGLADLIVGAPYHDDAYSNNNGRSYVIFGRTDGVFSHTAVDQMGTSGDDTLTGSAVSETLVGNAGNDTLIGGGGADVLYGGTGDDVFKLNAVNIAKLASGISGGNYARVDGGGGMDTIQVAGFGISFNLASVANQGGASPDGLSRIESIERIDLTGSGANTLTLGAKDVVDMAGMNQFNSGNGWLGLDATVNRHQVIVDGNADDTLVLSGGSTKWTDAGTVTHEGSTYIVYNHNTSAAQVLAKQSIYGSVVKGDTGNNLLTGGTNDDILYGYAGKDTLDGGLGADSMIGGGGNDTYRVDNIGDSISEDPNNGTDTILSSVSYTLSPRVEVLTLTGSASIDGTGNGVNNLINGNSNSNLLSGLDGNDTLNGGLGSDQLYGDAGNDNLIGGDGNDVLDGGAGNDTLTGGADWDVFQFSVTPDATNIDKIKDFSAGVDRITLDHTTFSALTTGALGSDAFAIGASAQDATDFVIYDSSTGALYYDADGNGAGVQVQFATLTPGLALTNSDFAVN